MEPTEYLALLDPSGLLTLRFHEFLERGMRKGQAFMNSLPETEYLRLSNTRHDPFYNDALLPSAVDFLCR